MLNSKNDGAKLGLGMIVKNEVDDIKRILTDLDGIFDEIQITITSDEKKDEIKALVESFGGVASVFEWKDKYKRFPFDAARNFNKDQFKVASHYLRLDCDDSVDNKEMLRYLTKKAVDGDMSVIYCYYDYAKDEWGNTNAAHYRETILKCTDKIYWNKPIHENVLPKDPSDFNVAMDENVRVIHRTDEKHSLESALRNIEYLLDEYKENGDKTDLRTIAYLGRIFMSIGEFDKAIPLLEKHISKSGWDEDRYVSWLNLAEIYKQREQHDTALACCWEALSERQDYPNAYLMLHDIYFNMSDWKKAIHWGKIGLSIPTPKTFTLIDPSAMTWRPALSMAQCYFELGQFKEAKKLLDYGKKFVPNLDWVKMVEGAYEKAVEEQEFAVNFVNIVSFLKKYEPQKMRQLVDSIPSTLLEEPAFANLKNQYTTPTVWGNKSIVIFCGKAWEEWSPCSVDKGIGGSEEAVIYISKELVKLGWEVTVYNTCGDKEGLHDGVRYVNYYKFNKNDFFNIVISWRNIIFPYGIYAKKKIVWLHDVPMDMFKKYDEIALTDKILVLSNYHKELLLENIGKANEEKAYVSSNGINLDDFNGNGIARDPYRIIYPSSYERGLEFLLKHWARIKEAVPQANLHIFYGWNTYDKMVKEGVNDGSLKKRIAPMMEQEGITHHGRIGHKQLVQEMYKSGIWAYPSQFPEISCITAMKSQACGCVPVVTDFAALKETVKAGVVVQGNCADPEVEEQYIQVLIQTLKDTAFQEEVRQEVLKHREEFAWALVAKDWSENLIGGMPDREIIDCRFKWIKSKCGFNDKIVDIGGNDGHTFDDWNRDNVTTVDIDQYDIPNFIRADAENLPIADKTFDIACLNEVLEHIPNPVQALKEAARVAKSKIIITVPNEHEWPERFEPKMTIEQKEAKEGKDRVTLAREANPKMKDVYKIDNLEHLWHIRYYDETMLKSHLEEAGLTKYKITKLGLGDWAFFGAEVYLDDNK